MAKVKLGFAGTGFMGQVAHLQNYLKNPNCEVVAIAEPRRELARLVAKTYGIPRIYASHLELAEDPDVEAVVASQPHLMNGYITIPLLKAGKSCFIEKPMAGSLEEAEEMAAAAEQGGAKLMVGFMKRYDDGVNRAKACLDECYETGAMGRATLVNAYCFGGDWLRNVDGPLMTDERVPPNEGFAPRNPAWMTDAQKNTFNIYMNIFSHNLNLMRYLFPGKLEVRAAMLRAGLLDQCTQFESEGVLANLYGAGLQADRWIERTEIFFERGWVQVNTPCPMEKQDSAEVEIYHGGQAHETKSVRGRPYWAFRAQADHFVKCMQDNLTPRSSGQDCLEDMRLMEDVFRKAAWV
ncbi:MAG TPA: Gfo/Idh/MocA family oxidoreductase [Candidatus Hydrogenedentes bacterium]|nr:Gfo/Idh/MocA family oxidoreductase [Candidatus Hydrogenedentota bacterium]HPG66400.1 Gfo/Idh/MocA family oxidoreductase [Candidatus Hydrogenedentota bacterium]